MSNNKKNPIDEVVDIILSSQRNSCIRSKIIADKREKNAKKVELLSPAGNLEKMKTALAFGADAVYVGIPDFSLRVRINDFDIKKIEEATEYCHERKKKIYVTINIFAHNKHLEKLPSYINTLKKIGVDALIVSDPGVISLIKENWKEAEIHLSTQANSTNWRSVKFWCDAGVSRVILGRETTLEEIKEIHEKVPGVELETFVHGAMCMAYSGRCFLSKYFVDRSGNLGDCVQPCRWKYNLKDNNNQYCNSVYISEEKRPESPLELVEEEHGSYILNSKDLNLLRYVKDLIDAGIVSLKIEGRAKSVYYQAMVNGIYSYVAHNSSLITEDEIEYLYKELEDKIINRGYTTGFILGEKADQDIKNAHKKIKWEFCGTVVDGGQKFGKGKILVRVHNSLKVGDEVEIVAPEYRVIKIKIDEMLDSKNMKKMDEAHGGSNKVVVLDACQEIPEYSVLRRKIEN